jgi:CubicO group peptidase (beta-lactamase class C family)
MSALTDAKTELSDPGARDEVNAHVRAAIDQAIANQNEIGVQVVAYLKGREVVNQAVGLADPDKGTPVREDTLFNVYSVSKSISAVALHIQVERGLIDYDASVTEYWPEFGANGKEATTVRDVITHRSGVPQMPDGLGPQDLANWDMMTSRIAALEPVAPPGTKALYQSMTFGWLVGEIVRRSDGCRRSFGSFIREEIGAPLDAPDLWFGLPPEHDHRVARLTNATPPRPPATGLLAASIPAQLALVPEVFGREDVRRAEIPAVGGLFSARSCARVWAMLANGGELDGVRLLSPELVATFARPRNNSGEPDPVMFGRALPISIAGFWLGGSEPPVCAAADPRTICHPGAGNSIAWADPVTGLAVAFCHNRMIQPSSREEDPFLPVANAVREALGLA